MQLPSNDRPPYLHWHVACSRCARLIFAYAGQVPGRISRPEAPVEASCPYCREKRLYQPREMVLHTYVASEAPRPHQSALAVIAGMIAAVRLARVESRELNAGSPRVRVAIADAVTVAKAVMAELGKGV